MKSYQLIYTFLLLFSGCQNTTKENTSTDQLNNIAIANQFVNAFYSFKKDSLQSMLSLAKGSQPSILFTVKDDLMAALKIDFNVTDTFKLSIKGGKILAINTASNDPDTYFKAKEWVKVNRPDLVKKACEGIWEGGPTPCECVQGMIKGFVDFQAKKN